MLDGCRLENKLICSHTSWEAEFNLENNEGWPETEILFYFGISTLLWRSCDHSDLLPPCFFYRCSLLDIQRRNGYKASGYKDNENRDFTGKEGGIPN